MERFVGQLVLGTPLGREFKQSILQEGREEGLEQGRIEAGQQLLAAFLRDRFGEHPRIDGIARILATWLEPAAAAHAVNSAASFDEFLMAHSWD